MQGDCSTVSTPSEGAEGLIDGNQRTRHGRTSGPARRSTRGQWTAEEDEILIEAVQRFKGKNWKKIAECFKDRTDVQCLHRWQKVLNPELVKGPWTKEEDEMIIELVNKYGPKKWSTIARYLPGRIGKQCRERWHNHLNPAINKEAWNQEEELILIRAHQIYGNRWAELTKFLPGRTDNGIKNHWHSSVKKKLDSYLASGLLDQYQTLPLVPFQNSSMPASSVDMQRLGDENGYIGGVSEKEIEYSQNSSMVGCSVSASGLPNGVINTGQHFHPSEIPCENEQTTLAAYHQDQYYYPTMDDITISISDTSEIEDSSKFPDQDLSQDVVTSSSQDSHPGLQRLPNIASLGLGDESSGLPTWTNESNHQVTKTSVWTSNSLAPTSISSMDGTTYKSAANLLISDVESCKVLFPTEENKGQCVSGTLIEEPKEVKQAERQDSLPYPSLSDIPMSESVRTSASQSCPSRPKTSAAPCKEALRPAPLIISANKHAKESTRLICHPFEAETKCFTNANDSFICIDDPVDSPSNGDGTANSSRKGRSFHVNDSKRLVPVNDFASQPDIKPGSPTNKEEPYANSEQNEEAGALCHEPLRFPSLDVPFFSCDLMQSKNDFLHDYSPLGLRKLLMSTMTCMSPVRLWGSPTRDQSPLLTSGTKTSFGAPSILKKRHRDLLSPLSERRRDKKLETDITANLAKDFSRLDVMFDESGFSSGASLEDKENQCHRLNGEHEDNRKSKASLVSSNKVPEETLNSSNSLDKAEKDSLKTNAEKKDDSEPAAPNDENLSAVLAESNTHNPFLFSPNQSFSKADKGLVSNTQTPRNQLQRTLVATSNKEHSPASFCLVINSPSCARNGEGHLFDNATSSIGNENLSIFCGTPFRNLESPSAWKSPLVINSFWSSPRFDPELTIEDMGYISPGDRSYSAIGFVEQINELTAATGVTDTIEVPGSEAPDTASKQKQTNVDKESASVPAECRVLDFNDCDSPTKPNYNIKPSTPPITSCSSPSSSSFLLKGCR